jgi:hypothetical protein
MARLACALAAAIGKAIVSAVARTAKRFRIMVNHVEGMQSPSIGNPSRTVDRFPLAQGLCQYAPRVLGVTQSQ